MVPNSFPVYTLFSCQFNFIQTLKRELSNTDVFFIHPKDFRHPKSYLAMHSATELTEPPGCILKQKLESEQKCKEMTQFPQNQQQAKNRLLNSSMSA